MSVFHKTYLIRVFQKASVQILLVEYLWLCRFIYGLYYCSSWYL